MAVEIPINARVFGAINRALKAEGFTEDEAYELAKRGAELLTASETPSSGSAEKPAGVADCKAADASGSDRPLTEFFSKLIFSRRMMLTVLATSATLIAANFFTTIIDLIKARQNERRVARSTVPRYRKLDILLFLVPIIMVFWGLIIFTMPGS